MTTDTPSPLERLMLVRAASVQAGREATSASARALLPYLETWRGPEARAELLARTTERLVARGFLRRSSAASLAITESGRQVVLEACGTTALPARRAWVVLRDTDCIAWALNLGPLTAGDRLELRSADGLRAALLRQTFDLPLPPFPTAGQTVKALAWKRLAKILNRSLDPDVAARCGSGPVVEVLASDWLEDGRRRSPARILAQLAARVAGAQTFDARALRRAVLTDWVRRREVATAAAPLGQP